jgi:predicted nucleic acid-binding protein
MKTKIIVDTNVVFSALLNSNSRIGRLLLNSRDYFEFYSCKYLQKEIQRHLSKIRSYSKLNDEDLFELINLIESRIFFIDECLLSEAIIVEAKELVSDIDFDDFAFVAITNHLDGLLWTGDKELTAGLRKKGYKNIVTTLELWEMLEQQEMQNPPFL